MTVCPECFTNTLYCECGSPVPPAVPRGPQHDRIREECDVVCELLQAKNGAYGNSALSPVRIFSRANPTDQLLVRIDDKLSRVARGSEAGEDVVLDLIGYLILLRIARNP